MAKGKKGGGGAPSANANVNFDVVNLLDLITSWGDTDRNDLMVDLENGTSTSFDVNFKVGHGEYAHSSGNSLPPMNPNSRDASEYVLGFEAAGAGCNVIIKLDHDNAPHTHMFMFATPVNKSNYFKYDYGRGENAFSDIDKCYSQDGHRDFDGDDGKFNFNLEISGVSPAVAKLRITEK